LRTGRVRLLRRIPRAPADVRREIARFLQTAL